METVRIHDFRARYHLAPSGLSVRRRLDGILAEVLDEALEAAVEAAGISPREELCIRELRVPVRLRLSRGDRYLIEQWGQALAAAIRQAAEGDGSGNVLRYASRLHGLLDFATGVANNRLQRAWAWRQLGFINDASNLTLSAAAENLLGLLGGEPTLILPLLRGLAEGDQLPALARRLGARDWQYLAQAAWNKAAPDAPRLARLAETDWDNAWSPPTSRLTVRAAALLAQSQVARAILRDSQGGVRHRASLLSWAVLIAAEAEPALLGRPRDSALACLAAIAGTLWQQLGPASAPRHPDPSSRRHVQENSGENSGEISGENGGQADGPSTGAGGAGSSVDMAGCEPSREPVSPVASAKSLDGNRPGEAPVADPVPGEPPEALAPYSLAPSSWDTHWGGLFFLLPVIDELKIPRRLLAEPILDERPFGWILQQLALLLLPGAIDDIAPAVFAGAAPQAPLPWDAEPPLAEAERAVLAREQARLSGFLVRRLNSEREDPLEWICRRPARLEVEPGWLTVVLPLADLSTEIRRAALDLDPGYLPWQGRVVSFRYE